MSSIADAVKNASIWWYAFGYFACYIPYSATAKALTKGYLTGDGIPNTGDEVTGTETLPFSVLATVIGMVLFISIMGWWKHARKIDIGGFKMPFPGYLTGLSGLCVSGIIATTTLAYTFDGLSIVFAMLLMRGGLLILSPVIDLIVGRHVRWFSWIGLGLSFGAVAMAFVGDPDWRMPTLAIIDIVFYLGCYFVRLQVMSRLSKSKDRDTTIKYFVEEQMTAVPALLLFLCAMGLLGSIDMGGKFAELVHSGFGLWNSPALPYILIIGIFSQGAGIFGTLILLDRNENAYCVPVNRSSSIVAGVVATVAIAVLFGGSWPDPYRLIGAGLVVIAILVLSIPPMLEKQRAAKAGQQV